MTFLNLFLITPCSHTNPIIPFLSVQEKHHLNCLSQQFKNLFDKSIFFPLINLYTQSPQNHTYHQFKYISSFQFSHQITNLGTPCTYEDIIFICDTSGSMKRNSKINSMIDFVNQIISNIQDSQVSRNIGIISFKQDSEWIIKMKSSKSFPYPLENDFFESSGMTNFDSWIKLIKKLQKPSFLVLISDMDTNIQNKNKYIPILKKHFFYQIILPPGNKYTSESLNHISNGYGQYFLSETKGSISKNITQKLSSLLTTPRPQLICYQTHSRYHPIKDFEVSLCSSSFLIEDEQQLSDLRKLSINIIMNGLKVEQWNSQYSRLVIRSGPCPWEIFKMSLIKKMSHLNYCRTQLLKKENTHCQDLEDIAYRLCSIDVTNREESYQILSDIYESSFLKKVRNTNFFSAHFIYNSSFSSDMLIDLNILLCNTLNTLEDNIWDDSLSSLIEIQKLGEDLTYRKIKKIKRDFDSYQNQYSQLYQALKYILDKEIKSILKLSSQESLTPNDNYNGLIISEKEYLGNLEGEQLESLIYLYCCLYNSDLFNFHLDGDFAEYIPSSVNNQPSVNDRHVQAI